jgi:hypothetical protein
MSGGRASHPLPPGPAGSDGAVIFTWRGDHLPTGWLRAYAALDGGGGGGPRR